MTKYIIAIAILLTGCGPGSAFNSDTKTISADNVSRLSTQGTDLRIYEFTPVTQPDYQCVFVAGDKKGSVDCFPKLETIERSE